MEEILQHLGWRKPLNAARNYLPTGAAYVPSTVWPQLNLLNVQTSSSSIPQFVSCAACRVESIRFVNQNLAWSRPMLMKLNYLFIYGVQWCATMETTQNAMKRTHPKSSANLPGNYYLLFLRVNYGDIQPCQYDLKPNLALQEKRQKNNIKSIIYIPWASTTINIMVDPISMIKTLR